MRWFCLPAISPDSVHSCSERHKWFLISLLLVLPSWCSAGAELSGHSRIFWVLNRNSECVRYHDTEPDSSHGVFFNMGATLLAVAVLFFTLTDVIGVRNKDDISLKSDPKPQFFCGTSLQTFFYSHVLIYTQKRFIIYLVDFFYSVSKFSLEKYCEA